MTTKRTKEDLEKLKGIYKRLRRAKKTKVKKQQDREFLSKALKALQEGLEEFKNDPSAV